MPKLYKMIFFVFFYVLCIIHWLTYSLQCHNTAGWATGRKCWVLVCWWWRFDWSFSRFRAPVVTTHHFHHP